MFFISANLWFFSLLDHSNEKNNVLQHAYKNYSEASQRRP